ncbi:MAG: hypothetical protein QM710_14345 [Flavobacterium sp.]
MSYFDRIIKIAFILTSCVLTAQTGQIPGAPDFSIPTPTANALNNYTVTNYQPQESTKINLPYTLNTQQLSQYATLLNEVNNNEKLRAKAMEEANSDIQSLTAANIYELPSKFNIPGTKSYRDLFKEMLTLSVDDYSIKDVNFKIENAYFENKLNKAEFDKTIQQIAEFLLAKMKEKKLSLDSNTAKNFILFEFFSQPMQVKGFKEKHFPIKYDFEDYWGKENWSKMFVTKLLRQIPVNVIPCLYCI